MSTNHLIAAGSTAATNIEPAPEQLTLVATKPEDMQTAQRQLAEWFRRKIDSARRDAKDALDNLEFARRSGLKHDSFRRASRVADRRVTFYEKCHAAVEAGYAIVPDFPVDVFAIRVRRARPLVTSTAEHTFTHFPPQHLQSAQVMPAGEGRYVTPQPYVSTRETTAAGAGRLPWFVVTDHMAHILMCWSKREFPRNCVIFTC